MRWRHQPPGRPARPAWRLTGTGTGAGAGSSEWEERDPLEGARAWKRDHPRAWALLVRWARADAARGRRCSIGFYAELLRRPEWWTGEAVADDEYRLNNTFRAGLVRLLVLGARRACRRLRDAAQPGGCGMSGSEHPYFRVSPRVWDDVERGCRGAVAVSATPTVTAWPRASTACPRATSRPTSAGARTVGQTFAELLADGCVRYDENASVVLLVGALAYQAPDNPNCQKAALRKLAELPGTLLLGDC